MRSNYRPRINIPGVESRELSNREYRLVMAVYEYYQKQSKEENTRLMNAALETHLAVLHRRYNFGAKVLRKIWEDTIRLRAGLRTFLRDIGEDGSAYEIRRTGENIEDTAIHMELLAIGVNMDAWERSTRYDERTGEVWFEDEGDST